MLRIVLALLILSLPFSGYSQQVPDPAQTEELIYRVNFGRADDIKILLNQGADPNTTTPEGDPVLIIAIERGDAEAKQMVMHLLEKGADPNKTDKAKLHPLIVAIKTRQADVLKALIAKGADIQATTANGVSAYQLAQQSKDPALIEPIESIYKKANEDFTKQRTAERFNQLVKQYTFNNCAYQYWSYYLQSKQDPELGEATEKKRKSLYDEINKQIQEFQVFYPATNTSDLQKLSDGSSTRLVKILDDMISNRYRREQGVGQVKDMEERCNKITQELTPIFPSMPPLKAENLPAPTSN